MQNQTVADLFPGYKLGSPLGSGGEAWVFATSVDEKGRTSEDQPEPLVLKAGRVGGITGAMLAAASISPDSGRFGAKALYFQTGSYEYATVRERDIPDSLWRQYQRLTFLRKTSLLPRVLEFGVRHGVPWYVMERLAGADMRSLMRSQEVVAKAGMRLLRQLLEDMQAARKVSPGFWHGDLKPENIMVGADGRCRLVDPAIGRSFDRGVGQTLTVQYNPLGLEGEQADTFSVATMVVEVFAGEQPFRKVRSPLIEYCCSGLRSTMAEQEKHEAVKNHLNVREVTQALPKGIQDLVSSWFLHPPTYLKMLEHWPNLDAA